MRRFWAESGSHWEDLARDLVNRSLTYITANILKSVMIFIFEFAVS